MRCDTAIQCSFYPCSSCKRLVQWNKEKMYLYHSPLSIIENNQFLFFCESCMIETLVYVRSGHYNFFEINEILKAIIVEDEIVLQNFEWKKCDKIVNMEFPSYSSLFHYFLNWYETNQFSYYAINFLIKNRGIPFRYLDLFIDYLIKKSNLHSENIDEFLKLRNYRLNENYKLAQLHKILPEDIILEILKF